MSNNIDNSFDRIVRSTLESGEEMIPAGMWESISSKLDEGACIAARKSWWTSRRKGFAIAGLALGCLAAGVIVFRTNPLQNPVQNPLQNLVPESNLTAQRIESEQDEVAVKQTSHKSSAVAIAKESKDDADFTAAENCQTIETEPETQSVAVSDEVQPTKKQPIGEQAFPTVWENEKSRQASSFQVVGSASTGGNLGKHAMSIGRSASSSINIGGSKITENECTFVSIPVSFGIGIRYCFNDKWSIGTGLNYTYLNRKFSGTFDDGAIEKYYCSSINNDQHYIGIPFDIYFTFAKTGNFGFYAYAGGTFEKCVNNRYNFDYSGSPMYLSTKVKGIQCSVTAGVGMQYNFSKALGIYLDPNFKYFFKNASQPKSIRTTQPFQLGCELGLRFNL